MHGRGSGFGPERVLRIVGIAILGVIGAALFGLAFGWFVQLLWNWLMPAIFGLGIITYWQAFGLVILGKLIFGGIGGGHGHRPHRGPKGDHGHWEKHGDWGPPECDRGWDRNRWSLWKDYWKEEGQDAFDRFVERRAGTETTPKTEK